jgi:hypothetical protein
LNERLLLDRLASEVRYPDFDRFDLLDSLLRSEDWATRVDALNLVGKMSSPPAGLVAIAESLLSDDNYLIRIEAVRVIGRHYPKEWAVALLGKHADSHHLVRAFVASYLNSLSDTDGKGVQSAS